ncbi:unnamed protein product, partial [Prorocentrum cordatum]
ALRYTNDLEWWWLKEAPAATREAYPIGPDNTFRYPGRPQVSVETLRDTMGSQPSQKATPKSCQFSISVRLATFNAKTGRDAEATAARRAKTSGEVLRLQFAQEQCHIIGVQEARNPSGERCSAGYFVLSSGSDGGKNLGVELWVSLHLPYGRRGGEELFFEQKHFRPLYATQRHLVVGCCAPLFRKVILVAHALHNGDEYTSQQRKQWWRDLIGICHKWKVQLAFLDANARLGSIVSEAVGSEGFRQDEDESGGLLHDMLLETGLAAANTLVPSLSKDSYTFVSTKSETPHRIDYIAVEQDMIPALGQHQVRYDIDSFCTGKDHYPVFMRFESQGSTKAAQQQSGYDARGTQDPDKAAAFRMHLAAFPTVPHQVDMNQHLHDIIQCMFVGAQACFPKPARTPIRPYVSEALLGIIIFRRQVRQAWRLWGKQDSNGLRRLVAAALEAGAPQNITDLELDLLVSGLFQAFAEWDKQILAASELAAHMLEFLVKSKPALRRALKLSRNELLDDLAQQLCNARSSNESRVEWRVLYQLQRFGGKRSKFQVDGLRIRRGSQGEVLATSGDLSEALTDYFTVIENGQALSWEELVERYNSLPELGNVYPRELDMITPFRRLKHDIMKAAKRRGAGPDGLSNDLFQIAPQECTQILLPLFVKVDMASREPLLFKGGWQCDLHKSGSPEPLEHYRGILLGCHTAKLHHAFLRSKLLEATMNMLSVVQQGALPQRGTDIASLHLRSAMLAAKARKRTYLSLYTDLKAAFYSVIRGFVARMAQSSEDIQSTLTGLEIPSCLEPLCHALVAKPGALDGLRSKHLLEAVVDVMECNWFQVRGSTRVVSPRLGTRPGMPLADLLFIIAFDPIIIAVNSRLASLGYLQRTKDVVPSQRIFRGRDHAHVEEDVWDPAFMDDLVNGIELLDARLWKEAAIALVTIMYEETKSRGFTMNWTAGKTELMAFFSGTGDIQDRAEKSSAMVGMNVFVLSINIRERFQDSTGGLHKELSLISDLILAGRVIRLVADFFLSSWDPTPRCKVKGGECRPLRSCDEPWGISARSPSEWKQLELDNAGLRAALTLALCAASSGLAVLLFLNPPAPQANLPCMWKVPEVRFLCSLQDTSPTVTSRCEPMGDRQCLCMNAMPIMAPTDSSQIEVYAAAVITQ